ncbi:TPR-like protein [Aspergillus phoenicis ATCC 13157]|uniref:TPR-like protein n=1 Tax=Aspergillus phoenicis ATCC 13157 TaxID=1353007 RepID=A0A370PVK1_ASPPH|nr:TPR-like protein [Aspergillus phoenicis ATCC 13157]
MARAFTYSPLDPSSKCIRLLELLPPAAHESVRCRLHVVDQTCRPSYVALSYTWGSPQSRLSIELDDAEFHVQENLWNFLSTMNSCQRWRLFWIDAICIDQSSISERNHQVNMMRDIYAGATLTVVWLGQGFDFSDLAIRYIANPGLPTKETTSALEKALKSLLEQPYWSRIWIVQELLLAKTVIFYCGRASFTWHQLASLRQKIKTHVAHHDSLGISKCIGSIMVAQKTLWDNLSKDDPHLPLSELLITYGRHQSSDVRDRVYALLGLASENSIQADYNLSVEDIYIEVLEAICKEKNPRHQLSTIEHTLQEMLCLQGGLRKPRNQLSTIEHKSQEMLGLGRPRTSSGHPIPGDAFAIRVLELRRQKLGNTHPHVLEGVASLAQLYNEQGRSKLAEQTGIEVLQIQREILGNKHPHTLQSMANLVSIYLRQGRLDKVEQIGSELLRLQKEVLSEKSPDTIQNMINLISTYRQQGKLKEAENMGNKVLQLQREILSEKHPDTLQSMINLMLIYDKQGKLTEAEEIGGKVLQLKREIFSEKHPDTLRSMVNLMLIYHEQGKLKETEKIGDEVFQCMANLVSIYREQGKLEEAEDMGDEVLQSMEKLVKICYQQDKLKEAEKVVDKVFQCMATIISIYREQGKLKEVNRVWYNVSQSIATLVSICYQQDKLKEAEKIGEGLLQLQREVLFGERHISSRQSMWRLISIYSRQGMFEKATEMENRLSQIEKS